MTLSLFASVSEKVHPSSDRLHSEEALTYGAVFLDQIWGGPEGLRLFESKIPPEYRFELHSLALETDPQIFFDNLIRIGVHLNQAGRDENAAHLFGAVAAFLEQFPEPFSASRKSAQQNYQALLGRGGIGGKAENILRKFCQEAADPATLLAMGVGSQAFSLGRLWTATRFARPGVIVETLAVGGGFLAETSAFTLTHKAVAATMGRPQDWSPKALGREWASGALILGTLKLGGEFSKAGLRQYMGMPGLGAFAQDAGIHQYLVKAIPIAGQYLGILAGQVLQEDFGFREKQEGAERLADGLTTLVQLHVGNGLMSAAFGKGYLRHLSERDIAFENWRQGDKENDRHPSILDAYDQDASTLPYARPALTNVGPAADVESGPSLSLMMSEGPPSSSARHKWTLEDFKMLGEFRAQLNITEAEALDKLHPDQRHMMLFSRLLQKVPFADRESRTTAFSKLGHALKHANESGEAGSYVNWLTRRVFNTYLESQDVKRTETMLSFLLEGGRLHDYEKLLAGSLPRQHPILQRIQDLPLLDESAKSILLRWGYTQAKAKEAEPHFLPQDEFLDRIGQAMFTPGYADLIGKALNNSARSPLPFERLRRIHGLLGKPDALTPTKLLELSDRQYKLVGSKHRELDIPLFGKTKPLQFNGYLGEKAPMELLLQLNRGQADLLDPTRAETRKAHRLRQIHQWEIGRARFDPATPAFWSYGFQMLADPFSRQIARDLDSGKFTLQVLSRADFESRCRELGMEDAMTDNAFLLHSGITGGKALMLVREFPHDHYSLDARPDPMFLVLAKIVHEYQHFLDIDPAETRTLPVVHMQEMRAHLREALWRAQYGDTTKLAKYHRDGNSGLAQHWRDQFESLYGYHFKTD
ncbi:MAG: hypothetical protein K8R69_01550 [Deltaproteobacteria bacterium]|nr:hypothetical protein [Deltaproteobacteria bacterium]